MRLTVGSLLLLLPRLARAASPQMACHDGVNMVCKNEDIGSSSPQSLGGGLNNGVCEDTKSGAPWFAYGHDCSDCGGRCNVVFSGECLCYGQQSGAFVERVSPSPPPPVPPPPVPPPPTPPPPTPPPPSHPPPPSPPPPGGPPPPTPPPPPTRLQETTVGGLLLGASVLSVVGVGVVVYTTLYSGAKVLGVRANAISEIGAARRLAGIPKAPVVRFDPVRFERLVRQ